MPLELLTSYKQQNTGPASAYSTHYGMHRYTHESTTIIVLIQPYVHIVTVTLRAESSSLGIEYYISRNHLSSP